MAEGEPLVTAEVSLWEAEAVAVASEKEVAAEVGPGVKLRAKAVAQLPLEYRATRLAGIFRRSLGSGL